MTTETIQGTKIHDDRFNPLRPVFRQWRRAIIRYTDLWKGKDASYWQNERCNVSTLAGAAWMARDFAALEEYATVKGRGSTKSRGRTDLYLTTANQEWVFEAKFRWIKMDGRKISPDGRHKKAVADASKNYDSKFSVGITFYVPWATKAKNSTSRMIERFIGFYNSTQDYDLISWCFPKRTRKLRSKEDRYFYPGILLVANLIDRR